MGNETINALSFSGEGDFAATNLDVQPDTMPATTWEAWVKPGRLDHTDWQSILSSDDGLWDRLMGIQKGGRSYVVGTGTEAWPAAIAESGIWQHIAVVYTPSNILFYKDGKETSYGFPPTGQYTMRALHLGRSPRCKQFFQGQLADVRIWTVARTAEQIREYMSQRLSGAEPGLAAYWPFENIAGSVSPDASGHGYDAYLAGAAVAPSDLTLAEPPPRELGAFAALSAPTSAPAATGGALPVAMVNGQYGYWAPPPSDSMEADPAEPKMAMSEPTPEGESVGGLTQAQFGPAGASPSDPESGPNEAPPIVTEPTRSAPRSPDCGVSTQTIFKVRQFRSEAKEITASILYEIQMMKQRKIYIERMTTYLNDRLRELNKVKDELADEQKAIQARNNQVSKLIKKEKLIKLQDVMSCINKEQEELNGAAQAGSGSIASITNQIAELRKNAQKIKAQIDSITSDSTGPGSLTKRELEALSNSEGD